MSGLVDRNAMGTAAGERRRRVNLADTENCVEGYFQEGRYSICYFLIAKTWLGHCYSLSVELPLSLSFVLSALGGSD